MHRTITSAALIAAATAGLASCTTVSPPPPEDEGKPQVVQAPAGEALESLKHAGKQSSRAHRSPSPSPTRSRHRTRSRRQRPHVPLPQLPVPQAPARPVLPPGQAPKGPDACALGRDFNRYQSQDSKVHLC